MHELDKQTHIESLIYSLFDRDDWRTVDAMDSFLYVYDRMPKRMRAVVDLKMSGYSNIEIGKLLKITTKSVTESVCRAKLRVIRSLSVNLEI